MNSFRAASLCFAVALGLVPRVALAQGPSTNLTAINSRLAAAEAAIATLQNALTDETNARLAAEAALQSSVNAEASARATADTSLQGNITAESTARTAADTALGGRASKLEGSITADDLVGTYKATGFITALTGSGSSATVGILTVNATFTLAPGGVGTFEQSGAGARIAEASGSWSRTMLNFPAGAPIPLAWSYSGGTLHVTVVGILDSNFNVGAGGRVLNNTERTLDPTMDLFVAVRLE